MWVMGFLRKPFFCIKNRCLRTLAGLEFFLFPVVLKISNGFFGRGELGRQLHGFVIKNGFVCNIYEGNALIDVYGKSGSLSDAKKVFHGMPERDCVGLCFVAFYCHCLYC